MNWPSLMYVLPKRSNSLRSTTGGASGAPLCRLCAYSAATVAAAWAACSALQMLGLPLSRQGRGLLSEGCPRNQPTMRAAADAQQLNYDGGWS